jgi:threonine/homoserine/homoserine lactone efflux protein
MEVNLFLRGLGIGFCIAAPVGPIGVLCIRRTLADGRMAGLVSGLGAAVADAIYGAIAAFGLTAISDTLVAQQTWLRLGGGVFLIFLGTKTFLALPTAPSTEDLARGLAGAFASTLVLTLTNPMTILSFALVFAGLGFAGMPTNYAAASVMVLGVFVGSGVWWLLLSGSVGILRNRFDAQRMRWVNRISGILIAGFGFAALADLFRASMS